MSSGKVQLSLKETSVPVIAPLGGISKNVTSTFLKTSTNPTANLESRPETTIVIHPGSRFLKIGRAKAAFPQIIPHCIAYKSPTPSLNMFPGDFGSSQDIGQDRFDAKIQDMYKANASRKKLPPNFYANLRTFNEAQKRHTQYIPLHNDSFGIEYTLCEGREWVTGSEALYINPEMNFALKWPLWNGRFALGLYYDNNYRECIGDMERIWVSAIIRELGIARADIPKHSAVIVVDDHVSVCEIKAYTELALQMIGLRAVSFLKTSQAATFGTGVSSSLVIDCGATKLSVSCVEDGVLIPGSCQVSTMASDAMLCLFHDLLIVNNFPVQLNLNKPLDFELVEKEIWMKQACLDEEELTATSASLPFEFFQRYPGKDTSLHAVKILDERCMPLLDLVLETDGGMLGELPISREFNEMSLTDALSMAAQSSISISRQSLFQLIEGSLNRLDDALNTSDSVNVSDRIQKVLGSVLFIGGGFPPSTIPYIFSILRNTVYPTLELVQAGIDARHVAWKGGAVLAKLDGVSECWIESQAWRNRGDRLLSERLPFPSII